MDVIDKTSAAAPVSPPKGAADQDDDAVSQTAMDTPGELKRPPAHTCLFDASQYSARTAPFGELLPKDEMPEEAEYDAMLFADVELTEEKLPAK